jgi:non-ribosomal peptide synthetase component F
MATAIKAAWAYVLAQETGKSDVLFGQVTNCRGILPDGGEGMVGMCLNTTPVRVEVKPTTRVRDVLAMVQQQHIKSVEYETNDWFDIVAVDQRTTCF